MEQHFFIKHNAALLRRSFIEKAATLAAFCFAVPHLASAEDPAPSAGKSRGSPSGPFPIIVFHGNSPRITSLLKMQDHA
jgi:hypothetical protein